MLEIINFGKFSFKFLPVGAVMKVVDLSKIEMIFFKVVDFPVPATPIHKIFWNLKKKIIFLI